MGHIEAVRAQAEEAERLHKEAYPERYETQDASKNPEPQKANEPEKGNTDPAPSQNHELSKADESAVAPNQPQDDGFKHKYEVLLGKYNAEVPRLSAELRTMKQRIGELEAPGTSGGRPIPTSDKKEAPAASQALKSDALKRVADEYGEDFVNSMLEVVRSELAGVKNEVVKEVNVKSKYEAFEQALSGVVPDWESVNESPGWLAFMDNLEPSTGLPYQVLLNGYHEKLDAKGVAGIFNAFKTSANTPIEAATRQRQGEIDAFIAPGKGIGGAEVNPNTHQQLKSITPAEIHQFYRDVSTGKYRGREAEQKATEAEIFKAQAEGRVY